MFMLLTITTIHSQSIQTLIPYSNTSMQYELIWIITRHPKEQELFFKSSINYIKLYIIWQHINILLFTTCTQKYQYQRTKFVHFGGFKINLLM